MDSARSDETAWIRAARAVRARAHAPYSGFRVGAALVAADGTVHIGCNVESASYGLTQCAERAALTAWIASGGPEATGPIEHVVLATHASTPTPPCGACRQWLAELAPGARVLAVADGPADGPASASAAAGAAATPGDVRSGGSPSGDSVAGGGGASLPRDGDSGPAVARAVWRVEALLPDAFRGRDLPGQD